MLDQTKLQPQDPIEVTGEVRAFAEQLGGIEGLTELHLSVSPEQTDSVETLRQFLHKYSTEILTSCEVPAIFQAYNHASRFEFRELVALANRLSCDPVLQPFAAASQQIGSIQLRKLRPLRDQRLVQRFLGAVETGEAFGSHLVVYGIILFLYSLPLRQGLINYGQQTLKSFVSVASSPLKLSESDCELLVAAVTQSLPGAVDSVLRDCIPSEFRASAIV
jgi:urease accessory protein UreF